MFLPWLTQTKGLVAIESEGFRTRTNVGNKAQGLSQTKAKSEGMDLILTQDALVDFLPQDKIASWGNQGFCPGTKSQPRSLILTVKTGPWLGQARCCEKPWSEATRTASAG